MIINICLSVLSLLQAFFLVKKDQKGASYRYFLYSLLFVMANTPILSDYDKIILIGIIAFKSISSSYKAEISDPIMFFINIAIVSYTTLYIHSEYNTNMVALLILIMLVIALIRIIMDKTLSSPIYILPALVLCSYFSSETVIILTIAYSVLIYTVHLFEKKKTSLFLLIAFVLPFIDSSIIYTNIQKLMQATKDINTDHLFWTIVVLSFLAIAKFYEKNIVQAYKTFRAKQLFGIIPVTALSMGTYLYGYDLLHPIPLASIIPVILIEARYLGFIKKIPFEQLLSIITKKIIKLYKFKLKVLRKIKAFYDIVIIRKIKSKNYLNKHITYKSYSFETILAIISIIVIALILILGDK